MENFSKKHLGKNVLVRSYGAGVHFGELVEFVTPTIIVLKNSRMIHYWDGAAAINEIAKTGVINNNSRVTVPVDEVYISQVLEIIPLSETSFNNLNSMKAWTRN